MNEDVHDGLAGMKTKLASLPIERLNVCLPAWTKERMASLIACVWLAKHDIASNDSHFRGHGIQTRNDGPFEIFGDVGALNGVASVGG